MLFIINLVLRKLFKRKIKPYIPDFKLAFDKVGKAIIQLSGAYLAKVTTAWCIVSAHTSGQTKRNQDGNCDTFPVAAGFAVVKLEALSG